MKTKRLIRKSATEVLGWCPRSWRHKLFRELLTIPAVPPGKFQVKFANTPSEYEQALSLLQRSYADLALIGVQGQIHATKFHTLPTSQIAIALVDGKVVATLTHVLDSAIGLPMEDHWNLDELRERGELVAEISSLAVDKSWRHNHGLFLFLTRFVLDHAINTLGVNSWVIVTHPRARDFYEGVLCFEPIDQKIVACDHVKGAAGFGQKLNLDTLYQRFFRLYSHKPTTKNIFKFYFETDLSKWLQPPNPELPGLQPMNEQLFANLFVEKSRVLAGLDARELKIVSNSYPPFSRLSPAVKAGLPTDFSRLEHFRSPIFTKGTFVSGGEIIPIQIINASPGGLRILCKTPASGVTIGRISISLPSGRQISVKAEVVWSRRGRELGLKVVEDKSLQWQHWVDELSGQFKKTFNNTPSAA